MRQARPSSRLTTTSLVALSWGLSATNFACAVELIDSIIEERGVTECSTSGSDSSTNASTSTSESSDTSSDTTVLGASTSSGEDSATSTGHDPETESSSTGPAPPVCGNGILEGEETCDDGNDDLNDGCQKCAKDSIVFVSSEYYQGYTLQGLYGADQRCRSLAGKASLPNHLKFKAWLSTPTDSAAERLLHSKGRYVLVNGLVVAQDWDALISGALDHPIIVDEISQTRDDPVWTGTLFNGEPALGSEFCNGWDESGALELAGIGSSMSVDTKWSFFDHEPCGSEARIYCIEQ